MRFDKYTIKAQEAVQAAESVAHRYNHPTLDPEHLLAALLEQRDGVVPPLLSALGVQAGTLAGELEKILTGKPKVYGDGAQLSLSPALNKALHDAEGEADQLKDEYVSTEHLLLALGEAAGRGPRAAAPARGRPDPRSWRPCARSAATSGSPTRTRRTSTRPWSATAAT